jgi:outer membrane protein assembly factor BamB
LGRAFANSGDITGDPVVSGGVVYVGTAAGRTGAFREDTGARIWTAEDGAVNPALVFGGSVFVVSDEGRLIRLDAGSGQRVWATDLPEFVEPKPRNYGRVFAHFGPVLAGGRLVTVSSDGLLRQYDPASGAVVGTVPVPGGAASSPALAGGMLFVVTARGQLLAFR